MHRHVGGVHAIESGAVKVSAEHHVVLAERRADETHVAQVGARAAVGAAAHAEADSLVRKAQLLEQTGDLSDQPGHRPLCLGDGEAAGRQRGARHRVPYGARDRLDRDDAVRREQLVDAPALRRLDPGQDEVLLRGEPDLGAQLIDDRAQPGAHAHAAHVRDAAVLHIHAQVEVAVALLVPSEVVVDRLPGERLGRLKPEGEPALHLAAKPVEAAIGDRVLEPGVAAVGPVAVVALHRDDLASDVDDLVGLDEGERQRDGDKCFRLVVGSPQPAADEDVEASDRVAPSTHRDDGEVLGVDVDAVVALKGDRRLELAGQVLLAVEGLDLRLRGLDDLTVEPDLVIRAGVRCQLRHHARDRLLHLGMERAGKRLRAAHDVAFHVAAAAQRRQHGFVDGPDRALQVALQHAMQLEVLARGDAQGSVGPAAADVVMRDVSVR